VYRHILGLLEEFCGEKARFVLAGGLALLATSVLMLLMPPWRRVVRAAWERGGWRGILLGLVNGLFSVAVGGTIVAALGGAMLVQSGLFDEQHGRLTQTNYEVIQTNWGRPHEQKELAVAHYVTQEQTVFLLPDGREIVKEDLDAAGAAPDAAPSMPPDAPPVPPAGPEAMLVLPPAPGAEPRLTPAAEAPLPTNECSGPEEGKIATFKRKVRRAVPQNSIVQGRIDVDVTMNYRQKGSAYYTCYEDAWQFDYTVRNRSAQPTEAEFRFPLPADQGVWNDFVIQVNGKDWAEHLVCKDNAQTWKMPMKPDEEVRVQVAYKSRGMEYIRYTPAYLAHRENYKVVMRIRPDPKHGKQRFTWKEDMGLPYGSMTPPVIKDSPADGEPMVLEWNLAKAATTLGMGVTLPKTPPAGYYVARLLHEAPLGLMLLAGTLLVTWTLLGRETDLLSLGILAVAYYLFYTLIAYLSDQLASFAACFVLAALPTLLLAGAYLWLGWGRRFASHQTLALVAAFTIYYPVAVIMDDWTGLLVQVLYWVLAAYVAMLVVAMVWRKRVAAV
jgi:hypothetical protein